MKRLLFLVLIFFVGCNSTDESNKKITSKLPMLTIEKKSLVVSKENISDIEAIMSQDNRLSFAYYKANQLSSNGEERWYISQVNGSLEGYIFSLMPMENGQAGWGEISNWGASINLENKTISIDNLSDNPTYEYRDWGLHRTKTDSLIQENIELIRNSTIDIKWWFFKASNGNWYFTDKKEIYKFDGRDSYDFQKINTDNLDIEFSDDNGLKVKIISSEFNNAIDSIPKLNLNHKNETLEIKKREGCNFYDIYENMFSEDKSEENYIRSICQAGIMQGDEVQTYNFEPYSDADRYTVARVTSLVYNYDEVNTFCSDSEYDNEQYRCYIDYAREKGFDSIPISGTLKKSEFYQYLVKLFWNYTAEDKFAAWHFLKDKGVLLKASLSEPAARLYVMDFMEEKLLRWELATLVMRCSRLVKEENPTSKGGELPYSITPDNKDISDTELDAFLEELFLDLFEDDFYAELFSEEQSEQREEAFFIPKNSLPTPVKIAEIPIEELPNAVVETAIKNIGKQAPYTDGKNTIDTRLITTVYGQDVKYESAKDMCSEYESQGKLQYGLLSNTDLRGYIACYKEDTPGTGGKGHVAIISDSTGDKEIGVQDTQSGVVERSIDKDNIKGVIAPKDINLPNFN